MLKKRREKILVILVFLVALLVSVKSFYFDAYAPEESEMRAYLMLEEVIGDNHSHILYRTGIFQTRVVSLKVDEQVVKARYRKYFLGAFPMGDRLSVFEWPAEKEN